jgi:hypothetical protein
MIWIFHTNTMEFEQLQNLDYEVHEFNLTLNPDPNVLLIVGGCDKNLVALSNSTYFYVEN